MKSKRSRVDVLFTLLAFALAGVLVTTWRTQQQRRNGRAAAVAASERRLSGGTLETLAMVDAHGEEQTLRLTDGRARVVIVLSTSCQACKRSIVQWERLAQDAGGTEALVFGLEPVADISRFISNVRLQPMQLSEQQLRFAFPSPYIPMTFVTVGDGRIAHVTIGLFTDSDRQRAQAVLDSLARSKTGVGTGVAIRLTTKKRSLTDIEQQSHSFARIAPKRLP